MRQDRVSVMVVIVVSCEGACALCTRLSGLVKYQESPLATMSE
jgi:hypothetical protein